MRIRPVARSIVLAAIGLLVSCSLDYGQSPITNEISADTPETILFDVTHTEVRDGSPRFVIHASRVAAYEKRKLQVLSDVDFQELDRDGSVVTSGTADSAEFHTDTEDFVLSGSLRFYSAEEDAWLTARTLTWSSDARTLTSDPAETVVLERGDGTRVSGRGFTAQLGRSIIRFEDGVSGTLIENDE